MDILHSIILVAHVLAGIGVVGLVLLQHGKGADMGAAFGSGASGSLFGATGSANFLSRATAVLAAIFFLTSLGLSYVSRLASGEIGQRHGCGAGDQCSRSSRADSGGTGFEVKGHTEISFKLQRA
jgi:protein translocase SecG subunit